MRKRQSLLALAQLRSWEAHPRPKCTDGASRRWRWGGAGLDTEEAVQEAIFNEVHRKKYNLAEEAPICQGVLRNQFGYTATSPTAQSVLDGT